MAMERIYGAIRREALLAPDSLSAHARLRQGWDESLPG
jgi:hypothetical protein